MDVAAARGAKLLGAISVLLAGAAGWACGPTRGAFSEDEIARRCHYDVTLTDLDSAELLVRARCDGNQVRRFVASEEVMAHQLTMRGADGEAIVRRGAAFELPDDGPAAVEYRLSLREVAREAEHIDVALEVGDAWVAAVSTWMMAPQPISDEALATLVVRTPKEASFASGLHRDDSGTYAIRASEIHYGTYSAFGRLEESLFELPGPSALEPDGDDQRRAQIKIVTLPGALLSDDTTRARWVQQSASAVASFWGGFPIDRACIVVVPVAGQQSVAHGKVVAAGGATVVIQLGSGADEAALYDDWILIHELFHLGFPSLLGRGKWLDEGLATYYEPIIRARAGWRTEQSVWDELSRDMPQGLAAVQGVGLDHARDFRGMYWGGAIVSLLADVEARRRSDGRFGLEHGLRAVLAAGGNASQMWSLEQAVATIDARLGSPTLGPLSARHASDGSPVDLSALMRRLGVERLPSGVTLHDDAELAHVRRAIVHGASEQRDASR